MPGAPTAQIEIVVDGVAYKLTGDPDMIIGLRDRARGAAEPGTPEAFAAFWQELIELDRPWLELARWAPSSSTGRSELRSCSRAGRTEEPDLSPEMVDWPLDAPLEGDGRDVRRERRACAATLVEGEDLATVLPVPAGGQPLRPSSTRGQRRPAKRRVVPANKSLRTLTP